MKITDRGRALVDRALADPSVAADVAAVSAGMDRRDRRCASSVAAPPHAPVDVRRTSRRRRKPTPAPRSPSKAKTSNSTCAHRLGLAAPVRSPGR